LSRVTGVIHSGQKSGSGEPHFHDLERSIEIMSALLIGDLAERADEAPEDIVTRILVGSIVGGIAGFLARPCCAVPMAMSLAGVSGIGVA
jgi:hypothetical protein